MTPEPKSSDLETVPFLGFDLVACLTGRFSEWIVSRARDRTRATTIAYLNAHTFNMACDSKSHADSLRRFTAVYPDGQAVVWASRWLGKPAAERINAADFIAEFFRECASKGLKVGLVGGKSGEAEKFAKTHGAANPSLNFVCAHHGYFTDSDEALILDAIQEADPQIVLVGMGSPMQEDFVLRASTADRSFRVWWCVGALFEYDSGLRRRAPEWMRRAGLEWLFRLALEPGRLWKRYLLGNPRFIWRVVTGLKQNRRV